MSRVYFSVDPEHVQPVESFNEAVERYLDECEPLDADTTICVFECEEAKPGLDHEDLVLQLLEQLDEEYLYDQADVTEPTENMRFLCKLFCSAFITCYTEVANLALVPNGKRREVNAGEWIAEHRPEWL